jgi:hypothetical protein
MNIMNNGLEAETFHPKENFSAHFKVSKMFN